MKGPIPLSDVCLLNNESTAHSKAAATAAIGSLDHNFHIFFLPSKDVSKYVHFYDSITTLQRPQISTFISVLPKVHIELKEP